MNDFFVLILLLLISGFLSGSELAFVVANKLKIELRARKKSLPAMNAYFFSKNPQNLFPTILIANNIVNIAFASISTLFLTRTFGLGNVSILIISTAVLLLFGELIPKYFSREAADSAVLASSIPLRIIYFILYPFVKITSSLSGFLTKFSNVTGENINSLFGKEDIETLVKEGHEAGVVHKNERDIISRVFELSEQRVYEAMRPRTDIVGVEINRSIDETLSIFIESSFSKLPVYDDSLDNIKGVVYAYDVFKSPKSLSEITREVIFVPETKRSFEMLNEFLSKQVSIAIVIDEFGGTAGIVTMEDIIEELFGEIEDEYDVPEDLCRKITPNTYIISGKVEIDYLNEKYSLNLPTGDFETLGGYLISKLGRIPSQGEIIKIDDSEYLIARATPTKIDLVKVTLKLEIPEGN